MVEGEFHFLSSKEYNEGEILTSEQLLQHLNDEDYSLDGIQAKLFELVTLRSFEDFAPRSQNIDRQLKDLDKYANSLFYYHKYENNPDAVEYFLDPFFKFDPNNQEGKRLTEERIYLTFQMLETLVSVGAENFPENTNNPHSPSKINSQATIFSLGLHLPAFIEAIDVGKVNVSEDSQHLMVGAQSLETVDAFRFLFPEQKLSLIDPEGVLTRLQAEIKNIEFKQINILNQVPDELKGRFDSIVTDGLFHSLKDTGVGVGFNRQKITQALINIGEMLSPHGVFIFTQRKDINGKGSDPQKVWESFKEMILDSGLVMDRQISTQEPKVVRFRHAMQKCLLWEKNVSELETVASQDIFLFLVRKQ